MKYVYLNLKLTFSKNRFINHCISDYSGHSSDKNVCMGKAICKDGVINEKVIEINISFLTNFPLNFCFILGRK